MKSQIKFFFAGLFILLLVVSVRAAEHPSFQLDKSAKRKLVEKAANLRAGDSFETVTNVLGIPSFNEKLVPKETDEAIGRSLKYYMVIWERGLVNELYDESIDVGLDKSNRVQLIRIKVTLE